MQNSQPINNCHGIYLGKVIQHLSHGQLKVYIHGIYPAEWETNPDLLPICMQVTPQFAGSNNGNGVFSYPNIGSTVVCMFANGDQNLPLTIGSLLGGMNAFGQYEWIKKPDEPISERHLITSGKSHVEIYENGKISAVVYDPIRTDAEVSYNDIPNAEISTDAVTGRPICDKVDAKELSNINCQFVLDNNINRGRLSASTHYYDPINKLSTTYLSVEQKTIVDSLKGEEAVDNYYAMDNNGFIDQRQTNSIKYISSYNITNIPQKTTEQTIAPLTSESTMHRYQYADGQEGCDMLSTKVDAYAYTFASQEKNILSTHNIKTEAEGTICQKMPGDFLMSSKQNKKITQQYTNNTTEDLKTFDAKQKLENIFSATNDSIIEIQTLSTNNSTEVDVKAQIQPHINKHTASSKGMFDSNAGIYFNNEWKDYDMKNIAGTEIIIDEKNIAKHEMSINPTIYSDQFIHHKQLKTVNGTPTKTDVQCQTLMSPSDGKFELKIVNNVNKMMCSILMDNAGNMTIDASTSLTIKAPTVTVIGETMTETFKQITTSASTINITGSSGDCMIKNVSLLNHVHQETQAGDIVSPQPTKSATASN